MKIFRYLSLAFKSLAILCGVIFHLPTHAAPLTPEDLQKELGPNFPVLKQTIDRFSSEWPTEARLHLPQPLSDPDEIWPKVWIDTAKDGSEESKLRFFILLSPIGNSENWRSKDLYRGIFFNPSTDTWELGAIFFPLGYTHVTQSPTPESWRQFSSEYSVARKLAAYETVEGSIPAGIPRYLYISPHVIVQELAEWDFFTAIQEGKIQRTLTQYLQILTDISQGLICLHNQGCGYSNLSQHNILIRPGTGIRQTFIASFAPSDLKAHIGSKEPRRFGNLCYVAPELYFKDASSTKNQDALMSNQIRVSQGADVYAWGMMAYQFARESYNLNPIHPCTESRVLSSLELQTMRTQLLEKAFKTTPYSDIDLLIQLSLHPDPEQRLSSESLFQAMLYVAQEKWAPSPGTPQEIVDLIHHSPFRSYWEPDLKKAESILKDSEQSFEGAYLLTLSNQSRSSLFESLLFPTPIDAHLTLVFCPTNRLSSQNAVMTRSLKVKLNRGIEHWTETVEEIREELKFLTDLGVITEPLRP